MPDHASELLIEMATSHNITSRRTKVDPGQIDEEVHDQPRHFQANHIGWVWEIQA